MHFYVFGIESVIEFFIITQKYSKIVNILLQVSGQPNGPLNEKLMTRGELGSEPRSGQRGGVMTLIMYKEANIVKSTVLISFVGSDPSLTCVQKMIMNKR